MSKFSWFVDALTGIAIEVSAVSASILLKLRACLPQLPRQAASGDTVLLVQGEPHSTSIDYVPTTSDLSVNHTTNTKPFK